MAGHAKRDLRPLSRRHPRRAAVSNAHAREGRWHEGRSHRATQTCVSEIDLDINVDVWKR
jgi:hypothetical protein